MIVAITDQCGTCGTTISESLALLRARSGRKVVVIDAGPAGRSGIPDRQRLAVNLDARVARSSIDGDGLEARLEFLIPRHHDILIYTDGRDTSGRTALIAAKLAIVPIQPNQADLECQYSLIARLNAARMFNPGLRVMFVVAACPADPTGSELARIRAYVGQVMAATLCTTIIHAHGQIAAFSPADIAALYHDVFKD